MLSQNEVQSTFHETLPAGSAVDGTSVFSNSLISASGTQTQNPIAFMSNFILYFVNELHDINNALR